MSSSFNIHELLEFGRNSISDLRYKMEKIAKMIEEASDECK